MSMSVAVPLSLLEDIFRLLEYLDMRGDNDDMHFHKSGYSWRYERDNAFWELKLKIRQLRDQVVETYLLTIDNITEDEKSDLLEWVAAGKSVYDNPCLIYDESGCPMDFINACRIDCEMAEDPSSFFGNEPDVADGGGWGDDLPF